MLRVKDEEMSRSGGRGRTFARKGAGNQTEDEEEGFSESELELYEQYKAAGYRDLVSACANNQQCVSDQSGLSVVTSCVGMCLPLVGVAQ